MTPTTKRLYEITIVSDGKYTYFGMTTDPILAQQEYNALKKLNTEDMIGLYSHVVSVNEIKYLHNLIPLTSKKSTTWKAQQ